MNSETGGRPPEKGRNEETPVLFPGKFGDKSQQPFDMYKPGKWSKSPTQPKPHPPAKEIQQVKEGADGAIQTAVETIPKYPPPGHPRVQNVRQALARARSGVGVWVSNPSLKNMIIVLSEIDVAQYEAERVAAEETDAAWRERWKEFSAEMQSVRRWVNLVGARLVTPAQVSRFHPHSVGR